MTTATIEQEVRALTDAEIANFTMTKPNVGQSVMWYPSGNKSRNGEMAFVLEAKHRTILIQRASGVCMETVRHVDDPKLKLSEDHRESGAWDFTDDDKQKVEHAKRLTKLEERMAMLEELLNEPAKKK